jgi:hypothetical protein
MNSRYAQHKDEPPIFAQRLISFAAGPAYEEEIAGDLHEQYWMRADSGVTLSVWYWQQVLLSLPSLVAMRVRSMSRREAVFETLFLTFALALIWFWETMVAQKIAWPMVKPMVGYVGLSAMTMCMTMYVILYGFAVALLVIGIALFRHVKGETLHFAHLHGLLLCIIATTPTALYLIWPNPLGDSIIFRLVQAAVVWGIFLLSLAGRGLRYPQRALA